MRFVQVQRMREMDRQTIEAGIPGEILMERAGIRVAEWAARMAREMGPHTPVLIAAGKGNNGGDGFVAARVLDRLGYPVEVLICLRTEALSGDARGAFLKMKSAGIPFRELPGEDDWSPDVLGHAGHGGLLIDSLLGTGATGAPHGAAGAAVACLARAAERCRILAVDVPSGLNADTGESAGEVVPADITVTMGLPKIGFLNRKSWPVCGRIEAVDIGLLAPPEDAFADDCRLLSADGLRNVLNPRPREAHKGGFGHVLVVAGSRGFSGAPRLCACGCLHSGAGLVSVAVPGELADSVAVGVPEAMVYPVPGETDGLKWKTLHAWGRDFGRFDVLVVGPGLGQDENTREIARNLLDYGRARVYDADALNALAGTEMMGEIGREGTTVITPHPGEAARLLGCDTGTVQADRRAAVEELVRITGAVVVLKGAGTLVAGPSRAVALSLGGNPGMASGGTGDVLAGLTGGLLGQGLDPYDAARLGVYLHAAAGDLAAWKGGQGALSAQGLAAYLGRAALLVSVR